MELRLQIVGPLISKVRHNRDCSGNKRYVKEASQGNILFPFGGIRHNAGGTRYRCEGGAFSPRTCYGVRGLAQQTLRGRHDTPCEQTIPV